MIVFKLKYDRLCMFGYVMLNKTRRNSGRIVHACNGGAVPVPVILTLINFKLHQLKEYNSIKNNNNWLVLQWTRSPASTAG